MKIDIEWLRSADLEDLKKALKSGYKNIVAINKIMMTEEGKSLASKMLNSSTIRPKRKTIKKQTRKKV